MEATFLIYLRFYIDLPYCAGAAGGAKARTAGHVGHLSETTDINAGPCFVGDASVFPALPAILIATDQARSVPPAERQSSQVELHFAFEMPKAHVPRL